MSLTIVLDAGPLGLLTNPKLSDRSLACTQWFQAHMAVKNRIILPEIADYEVRRELVRANKQAGIQRLDQFAQIIEYLPINTEAMRQAAKLWAYARQMGQPTAGDQSLDADMILVAQAQSLGQEQVVIATTNVKHLFRFILAQLWTEIRP